MCQELLIAQGRRFTELILRTSELSVIAEGGFRNSLEANQFQLTRKGRNVGCGWSRVKGLLGRRAGLVHGLPHGNRRGCWPQPEEEGKEPRSHSQWVYLFNAAVRPWDQATPPFIVNSII